MAFKTVLFVSLMVAAIAAPIAEAQIWKPFKPNSINIQGTLFCTPDGNMGANGTATPVFPNATVKLQCNDNMVDSATTDGSGKFVMDFPSYNPWTLLNDCSLKVDTPQSTCNTTLPTNGTLQALLRPFRNTDNGFRFVSYFVAARFRFMKPRI